MTDRELLELAAKAAGLVPDGLFGNGLLVLDGERAKGFNPLSEDGDAFRLVALLGLDIEFGNEHVWCCIEDMKNYIMHPFAGDRAAAARRVVVESAAAIQQAKEAQ